jgi:hypothetical protein
MSVFSQGRGETDRERERKGDGERKRERLSGLYKIRALLSIHGSPILMNNTAEMPSPNKFKVRFGISTYEFCENQIVSLMISSSPEFMSFSTNPKVLILSVSTLNSCKHNPNQI